MAVDQPHQSPDLIPHLQQLTICRGAPYFHQSVRLLESHARVVVARAASVPPQRWEMLAGYRTRLLALARRCGGGVDSEDVVHEALLRAAVSDRVDGGRPWPYLATMVVNLVRDRYRRAVRDRRLTSHAALLPRQRSLSDDVATTNEAQVMVRKLVESEPLETVLMAWRCYVEGMGWREVAAEFGKPSSAAEAQVRRAFLRIRRRFAHRRDDSAIR